MKFRGFPRMIAAGAALFLSAALLAGCTPSRNMIARNVANATATVAPTEPPPPTEVPAGEAVAVAPTEAPATTQEFVLIWELFGTPTPGGAQITQGEVPTADAPVATVTPAEAVAAAPTEAPAENIQPTATAENVLPATATPRAVAQNTAKGDPRKGQSIFTGIGTCSTCHDVVTGVKLTGPSLKGIASRAGAREPDVSAEDYLRESIFEPNKYIVNGFSQGIMPQTFKQILTAADVNNLIAYLMTLK